MICKNCGMENDTDAVFCKYCGSQLTDNNKNSNNNYKPEKRSKGKTKVKKKKVTKTKYKKEKNRNNKQNKSTGKNIIIFILSLLIIGIIGIFIYLYYNFYTIEVPDVLNMNVEEATNVLAEKQLKVNIKTKLVDDEKLVDVVISVSPKEKSKVPINKKVTLTIGKLTNEIVLDNYVNLNIDEAKLLLDQKGIKYKIVTEKSNKENNTVIKQSKKAYSKINKNETIIITISKQNTKTSDDLSDSKDKVEDNSKENDNNSDVKTSEIESQ